MSELRSALRTIHADKDWWKKVLTGGALWMTLAGWPIVEGHQIESIDNSQRGFPTPLPRWNALLDKAVIGLFAMVIDFFFFIFPVLCAGMVLFCGTLATGLSGNEAATRIVAVVVLGPLLIYLVGVWMAGVSIVAKQRYVANGELADVLAGAIIRDTLRSPERGFYLRARLQSLPPYGLALAVLVLAVWLLGENAMASLLVGWLGFSALLYARLVSVQLYMAASRGIERQRFEARRRRVETSR